MADRILGLDYGRRRVGIAVSDGLGVSAQPLEVVDRDHIEDRLVELVAEYGAKSIVVGLPVSLSGTEGAIADEARQFGIDMAKVTGLPVVMHNEQYTSALAERVLLEAGVKRAKRKASRDKLAATVMLQGYLDARS